jgi:hypothetical protein
MPSVGQDCRCCGSEYLANRTRSSAKLLCLLCRAFAIGRFPTHCAQFVVLFRVMPTSVSCRVEQPSTAAPASVYDVLMDVDQWPDFMPGVSAASWDLLGTPNTGVGGVRRVRVGLTVSHDRIVDGTRPHHHAYVASLPWYVPLKDYKADVCIEDQQSGSLIVWTASCTRRFPGALSQSKLQTTYERIAAALAQEAEHRSR